MAIASEQTFSGLIFFFCFCSRNKLFVFANVHFFLKKPKQKKEEGIDRMCDIFNSKPNGSIEMDIQFVYTYARYVVSASTKYLVLAEKCC